MTALDTSTADATLATETALAAGPASAVSWPAIFAGAATASAVSLLLLALGSGLGLATAAPWVSHGASPVALTSAMLIWLIVMQWAASGMGGYITGRLRTRWHGVHTHEVFFRDTAHGLLAWAVASLFAAALLGSALADAGGAVAGAAQGGSDADQAGTAAFAYDSDFLFRSLRGDLPPSNAQARLDAQHILASGLARGSLSPDDSVYLNALVVAQTGIAPAEAQRRIDMVTDREQQIATAAKQAADTARKTAASLAIFTSLSMLIGALIACVAAALGGMQRDEHL